MLKNYFSPNKGVLPVRVILSESWGSSAVGILREVALGMKWADKELRTELVKSQIFTGMKQLRSTGFRRSQGTANIFQKRVP